MRNNTDPGACAELVGERLRAIRTARGLTLRALAEMSGLSVNTLSLIENKRTSPSVGTLQQLATQLGCPITAFFQHGGDECHVVFQRTGERNVATYKHGTLEILGEGMPRLGVEPIIFTLLPKAKSGDTPQIHTGREFVFCISGHLNVTVERKLYQLSAGDSLLFDAYLPHAWENPDAVSSSALFVLCQVDSRDCSAEDHFER